MEKEMGEYPGKKLTKTQIGYWNEAQGTATIFDFKDLPPKIQELATKEWKNLTFMKQLEKLKKEVSQPSSRGGEKIKRKEVKDALKKREYAEISKVLEKIGQAKKILKEEIISKIQFTTRSQRQAEIPSNSQNTPHNNTVNTSPERLNRTYETITINTNLRNSPLYMSNLNPSLADCLGAGQATEIIQSYNQNLTGTQESTKISTLQEIHFPLIVDSLKTMIPNTLSDFLTQQGQDTKLDGRNLESFSSEKDLLAVKKIEGKYILVRYQNGNLKMATEVSPGAPNSVTPKGIRRLEEKQAYRPSRTYNEPMPYSIHINKAGENNGYYIHQGVVDGSGKSHGCIRVPGFYQQFLFQNIPDNSNIPLLVLESEGENSPEGRNNTNLLEKYIQNEYLVYQGKKYKINIHTTHDSEDSYNFFNIRYNGYGVPQLRYEYGYENTKIGHKEAYEAFVLLTQAQRDYKKIWEQWQRTPNGQRRTTYLSNYITQHIEENPNVNNILAQAKQNVKQGSNTTLTPTDHTTLKHLLEREVRKVDTQGQSKKQRYNSNPWPLIIKYKGEIFIGANLLNNQGFYMYLGPQGKYFTIDVNKPN